MQDLIAVVELSTDVTLVGAVVLSAWPNIKNRIGDYHVAHDEAGRKDENGRLDQRLRRVLIAGSVALNAFDVMNV
jgi:hypothetical protein